MAIQYPWTALWASVVWGPHGPHQLPLNMATMTVCVVLAVAPTILGVSFGCYSVLVAGADPRNLCGVVGLSLVVGEWIWIVHDNGSKGSGQILAFVLAGLIVWLVFWNKSGRRSRKRVRASRPHADGGRVPLANDVLTTRELFDMLFAVAAALSAQMLLITCLSTEHWHGETRAWAWDEPQTMPPLSAFVRGTPDPRLRTVATSLAPGVRMVRSGEAVIGDNGWGFQDYCYVAIATPLLVILLAILPAIWLLLWLGRVFARRARAGHWAVAG